MYVYAASAYPPLSEIRDASPLRFMAAAKPPEESFHLLNSKVTRIHQASSAAALLPPLRLASGLVKLFRTEPALLS
ncbi:hypothetical protein D3C73_1273350 [compost metagenome]